jgi:NTP pyrophosphatase (non-canonical NTP hydrolase)
MKETIQGFLFDVENEVLRAQKKFPNPNLLMTALTEECGELAEALLEVYYNSTKNEHKKGEGRWSEVYKEAMQVAAVAARIALEGDPSLGVPSDDSD